MKEDLKEQFWTQIKAGNEKAFCELYEQYADMLYGYGMRIIADDIIVNNAIQSLFVYLFEKRHNLSVPNSINAYLCVSLKRLI
ncbi:MAG: sigma-70 family RNA polymerase sigma factor, partial [Muribaculaceae bacterium]